MDKRILAHADALFNHRTTELIRTDAAERNAIRVDAAAKGLSSSGITIGKLVKASGDMIARTMHARLKSFQEAFSDSKIEPSPEDLSAVWTDCEGIYKQAVNNANQHLRPQATQIGLSPTAPLGVEAFAAYGHDSVLADFRVWRSRVGLARVSQVFANSSIVPLKELKDKAACTADLQTLLDSSPESVAAVLYIDLDNFKAVNTAKEHVGGDKCIGRAAAMIGSVVVHKGRLYRVYGTGDEFAVILPNYNESEARAVAERIRQTVEEQKPGEDIEVTTSIGVTIATGATTACDALIQADKAMFEAKKTKNTVYFV